MSSVKACENHARRKPKVSYARSIRVGLVGPKPNPKGEGDGQWVNIPTPPGFRFKAKGRHRRIGRAYPMDMVRPQSEACWGRQIHSNVKLRSGESCGETQSDSTEFTLSRKTSLLESRCPYRKPTLVGGGKSPKAFERPLVKELGNLTP
jgi:hypothetical protein